MNEKFLVPFNTAQLLKEKGYNENNDYVYNRGVEDGKECIDIQRVDFDYQWNDTNSDIDEDEFTSNICTAPTYHEVLNWLEKKGVRVYAEYNEDWIGFVDCSEMEGAAEVAICQTRKEALNEAIIYALKLI